MINLDKYLNYLHEDEAQKWTFGGELKSSASQWATFSLLAAPATILAWKLANAMFSKADRTCGGPIANRTPGFKACVTRERMKAFQKQLTVAQKALGECNQTKNPIVCKQKWRLEIEKCKNKIINQQQNIKNLLGENENIQEISISPTDVLGFGASMIAMDAMDKSLFIIKRLIATTYDKNVRKCGLFKNDTQRQLCMAKYKLDAQKKGLAKTSSLLGSCSKTKNPDSCAEKINKRLEILRRNIKITQDDIISYTNTINGEKREELLKKSMNTKPEIKET